MVALDLRIINVGIEVNGQINTYSDLAIWATGTKFANANQNQAQVKIANLNKANRDYLITETSPFNLNRTPKRLFLEAGRKSYGVSRIFVGDIVTSTPSQPPDIVLTLDCLTNNFSKGTIVSRTQASQAQLSTISRQVANDLGVNLDFQATDRQIGNYTFTGGTLQQVDKLGTAGNVDAYIDDGTLVVKDTTRPLVGRLKLISAATGMIGIPEITEQGVKVKFLLDGETVLGGLINIQSELNPAANGNYIIYKLSFDIANRDEPFYWIAEGKRPI